MPRHPSHDAPEPRTGLRRVDRDLRLYVVLWQVDGAPCGYVGIGTPERAHESADTWTQRLVASGRVITRPAQVMLLDVPRLRQADRFNVSRVAESQAIAAAGLLIPLLNASSAARTPVAHLVRQVGDARVRRLGTTVIAETVAALTSLAPASELASVDPATKGPNTVADVVALKVVHDATYLGAGPRPIPTHEQMANFLGSATRGVHEWRLGRIRFGELGGQAALTATERTREVTGFALSRLEFSRGGVAPAPWTLQLIG